MQTIQEDIELSHYPPPHVMTIIEAVEEQWGVVRWQECTLKILEVMSWTLYFFVFKKMCFTTVAKVIQNWKLLLNMQNIT